MAHDVGALDLAPLEMDGDAVALDDVQFGQAAVDGRQAVGLLAAEENNATQEPR